MILLLAFEKQRLAAPCGFPAVVYRKPMILSAVITEAEEGGFTALNPETGTTTQGETFEEAMECLREATELYLEEFPLHLNKPSVMTSFEVTHA